MHSKKHCPEDKEKKDKEEKAKKDREAKERQRQRLTSAKKLSESERKIEEAQNMILDVVSERDAKRSQA